MLVVLVSVVAIVVVFGNCINGRVRSRGNRGYSGFSCVIRVSVSRVSSCVSVSCVIVSSSVIMLVLVVVLVLC